MIESLLPAVIPAIILALGAWVFNQNRVIGILQNKTEKLEEGIENLADKIAKDKVETDTLRTIALSMDSKMDKRINNSLKPVTDLLHELQLTMRELNVTINYLKDEFKEIKNKSNGDRS